MSEIDWHGEILELLWSDSNSDSDTEDEENQKKTGATKRRGKPFPNPLANKRRRKSFPLVDKIFILVSLLGPLLALLRSARFADCQTTLKDLAAKSTEKLDPENWPEIKQWVNNKTSMRRNKAQLDGWKRIKEAWQLVGGAPSTAVIQQMARAVISLIPGLAEPAASVIATELHDRWNKNHIRNTNKAPTSFPLSEWGDEARSLVVELVLNAHQDEDMTDDQVHTLFSGLFTAAELQLAILTSGCRCYECSSWALESDRVGMSDSERRAFLKRSKAAFVERKLRFILDTFEQQHRDSERRAAIAG